MDDLFVRNAGLSYTQIKRGIGRSGCADLLLVNGKILFGERLVDKCIALKAGKICFIGMEGCAPRATERIDLKGNLVIPGLIDAHVHLRDLNLAYKEDFYTGTCSALAGGFCTVLEMPAPVQPSKSLSQLQERVETSRGKTVANVGFYSALPDCERDLGQIMRLGIIGFKWYMNRRENCFEEDQALDVIKMVGSTRLPIAVHAEDLNIIEVLEEKFRRAGNCSPHAFIRAHPPKAEKIAVSKIIKIAKKTNAHIHICHMSTSDSLGLVKEAKSLGASVTCEATPHHLFLSRKAIDKCGGIAITAPPLRTAKDTLALMRGLVDGSVDIVASDHAPHSLEEKRAENVWSVPPGVPGLETTLPLFLTAVAKGQIPLSRVIEILAEKPARLFGLRSKGVLGEGFDGDLAIVDLKKEFVVDPERFHTKAKYSPFSGWRLKGMVVKTFVGGRLAMDDGVILSKPGSGGFVGAG
jgi:dihydroorotase